MAAVSEQEPRFTLPDSTRRSSTTIIFISGIKCYVYGLDDVARCASTTLGTQDVACLFLAHNRKRTYLVTEGIAQEVLWRYRNGFTGFDGKRGAPGAIPLIAATFDMRNHGEREISKEANLMWEEGNENHAADLVSLINGSAQDLHLIISLLPSYLPHFSITRNFVFGFSLGGHCAWRLPRLFSGNEGPNINGMAIAIGSPDLTGLLLSRLGVDVKTLKKSVGEEDTYKLPYEALEGIMSEQQKRCWPKSLHDVVAADDRFIDRSFPLGYRARDTGTELLLQNGVLDTLVPPDFTESWVKSHGAGRGEQDGIWFVTQENTGHSCTKEMVARVADWLRDLAGK